MRPPGDKRIEFARVVDPSLLSCRVRCMPQSEEPAHLEHEPLVYRSCKLRVIKPGFPESASLAMDKTRINEAYIDILRL